MMTSSGGRDNLAFTEDTTLHQYVVCTYVLGTVFILMALFKEEKKNFFVSLL